MNSGDVKFGRKGRKLFFVTSILTTEDGVQRNVPPGHNVIRKLFVEDEDDMQPNVEQRAADVDNENSMIIRRRLYEDQLKFMRKYNYDPISDVPLHGRYTWGDQFDGVRLGSDNTQNDMVANALVNEDGNSVQRSTDNTKSDTMTNEFENEEEKKIDSNKTPMAKTHAAEGPPLKKTARDVNSDDEDDNLQRNRVIPPFNL